MPNKNAIREKLIALECCPTDMLDYGCNELALWRGRKRGSRKKSQDRAAKKAAQQQHNQAGEVDGVGDAKE